MAISIFNTIITPINFIIHKRKTQFLHSVKVVIKTMSQEAEESYYPFSFLELEE